MKNEKRNLVEQLEEIKNKKQSFDHQNIVSNYSNALEEIATRYSLTIEELLLESENSLELNEDFFTALSLSRKIHFLKEKHVC